MDREALLRKVDNDEGLTVEEIIEYRKIAKHVHHVYYLSLFSAFTKIREI